MISIAFAGVFCVFFKKAYNVIAIFFPLPQFKNPATNYRAMRYFHFVIFFFQPFNQSDNTSRRLSGRWTAGSSQRFWSLNCQLLNRGGPFGVPIQWLTTAHKIPCWRGDGSRSGPSPCKARRDITPLSSLVTSFIIKSDSIPALRAGAAALFSGGNGLDIRFFSGFVGQHFGCCNYLYDRGPAHSDGRY